MHELKPKPSLLLQESLYPPATSAATDSSLTLPPIDGSTCAHLQGCGEVERGHLCSLPISVPAFDELFTKWNRLATNPRFGEMQIPAGQFFFSHSASRTRVQHLRVVLLKLESAQEWPGDLIKMQALIQEPGSGLRLTTLNKLPGCPC